MAKPIRLSQEEYNRLCNIEYYAGVIYDFMEGVGKPDWTAHRDDEDQIHSRVLYCHINMRRLLGKCG
jgi:hypothetical protein